MAEFDNTNRGSLWANKKKRPDKQDPDFTGDFTDADGIKYFVDAWRRKEGANPDAPALNFKIKRKEQQPQREAPKRADPISSGHSVKSDMDDDIPFSPEFR